ncbi:MFS transporter [Pseudomonas sp. NPDC089734]|uniref:MFS transporter n=1 Tax=Pseudomonas sp. NPDC089734 TaxID=3364469 RepID=UPI00382608B8
MTETSSSRRYWVLLAVCAAGLILPLEYTGPAMALPAIQQDLGGSPIALAWIVNAFALSFGSAVMAAGALADQYGRKKMFCWGIGSFAILSLIVSLAPSVVILDLLRGAQGFAAALTMAGGSATLAQEFDGHDRTRAFGLLGTAFGLGLAFGPVISGIMVELLGWRSIFFLGAIFGAAAWMIAAPCMRESRDPDAGRLDKSGLVTFTAFLLLLTFAIMQIPQHGWQSLQVIGLLTAALIVLTAFIILENRHERPMLDLSLFRYRRFVGVQFLPIATAICFIVLLILLPIRFIGAEGMSATEAGAMMMALSAPMMIVPFIATVLARKFNSSTLSCLGLLLATIGLGWLANVPVGSSWMLMALPMLLIGIGTGLPWGLMDDLSISVVPIERAGMATGIFTTMRACGEAICVAASLALLTGLLQQELAPLATTAQTLDAGINAIANHMATGNMPEAKNLMHTQGTGTLEQIYSNAFSIMLYVLMALTLIAAAGCSWALSSPVVRSATDSRSYSD